MNILILGGGSPRHKTWVRQVAEVLRPLATTVQFVDYRHWETGDTECDVAHELARAATIVATMGSPYIIVAKSIGSVITIMGVANGRLAPERCVLFGLPLGIIQSEWHSAVYLLPLTKNFARPEDALAALPETVIVQNEDDPHGSAQDVSAFVRASMNNRITVNVQSGDTHDYVDMELISRLVLAQ